MPAHIFNSFLELKELAINFDEVKVKRILTKLNNPTFVDSWFYKNSAAERFGSNFSRPNPWIEMVKTLTPLSGEQLRISLQKEIAWFFNNIDRHKLWLRK